MDKLELLGEEIQHLVIAALEGSATEEERGRLQEWLAGGEERVQWFEGMRRDWVCAGMEERYGMERAWNRVQGKVIRMEGRKRQRRLGRWIGAAAVAVLLVGGGVLYWMSGGTGEMPVQVAEGRIEPGGKKAVLVLGDEERVDLEGVVADSVLGDGREVRKEGNTLVYGGSDIRRNDEGQKVVFNRLITPRGGEYTVVLEDGTKVWVNAESELKYPVRFAEGERRVWLDGEAYFDVAKDGGRRFVVCSGETEVTVLGTEFNVKNYVEDVVATTLVEGTVQVKHGGMECHLKPGQQAMGNGEGLQVRDVETMLYTAWKDGFFVYRDATLDEIMKELSRWYDFTYFYQSPRLETLSLTARLRKFDHVEDIFEILKNTGQFDFVVKGKTVTVVAR